MSYESYYSDHESLDFLFGTEIPEEDFYGEPEIQQLHENNEISLTNSSIEFTEDEKSFVYDQDFEPENPIYFDFINKIKHIDVLRLILAKALHRKSTVMNMLAELFENGLCESEVPTIKGTKEEVYDYYNSLLIAFNNKKISWMERERLLKEKIDELNKKIDLKRKEHFKIMEKQYDLELKTFAGMDNRKTPLTRNEVARYLDEFKLHHQKVSESRLIYIIESNKCKKLKYDIKYLSTNSTYITNYENVKYENEELERLVNNLNESISNNRDIIINTKEKISKLLSSKANLENIKENKVTELTILKDQWRKNIIAKSHEQKHLIRQKEKALKNTDYFSENPLLLKDYYNCVERARENRKRENDLRQKLDNGKIIISQLKAKYEKKENKMNLPITPTTINNTKCLNYKQHKRNHI